MSKRICIHALILANQSTNDTYQHGAVIYKGGKALYSDYNTNDCFQHAEIGAIKKLCKLCS